MNDALIGQKPEFDIPFTLNLADQHVLSEQETTGGYHGRCIAS